MTWELKQLALVRSSAAGTKAEWMWCVLRNNKVIEAYADQTRAIERLEELRNNSNES